MEEENKKDHCCNCGEECNCGGECHCGNECHCDENCSCGCNHEVDKKEKKKKGKKEVEELNIKLAELNDKYLRLNAEYMNFRTRTSADIEKMFKYSNETLAIKLLPVIDNFERAIKMDDSDLSDEVSKFLSGFKMIYTAFKNTLNEIGVTEMDLEGKEFDPNLAEAVITEHDENKPENVILEVLQKGYFYKDKVIRHAMVKVNK